MDVNITGSEYQYMVEISFRDCGISIGRNSKLRLKYHMGGEISIGWDIITWLKYNHMTGKYHLGEIVIAGLGYQFAVAISYGREISLGWNINLLAKYYMGGGNITWLEFSVPLLAPPLLALPTFCAPVARNPN